MVDSKEYKGKSGEYIVYSDGRVWSKHKNKFMNHFFNKKTGYYQVAGEYTHRIIAKCFIDNPQNKRTVNHKSGDKSDNSVQNLEWATHSENHKHAFKELGRKPNILKNQKGQGNFASKLKDSDVIEIRNSTLSGIELAKKYGVSRALISRIRNRIMWTHI